MLSDNQEGGMGLGEWEGGSIGRGHIYTYDWFTLLYGRKPTQCCKAIIQLKKFFLIEGMETMKKKWHDGKVPGTGVFKPVVPGAINNSACFLSHRVWIWAIDQCLDLNGKSHDHSTKERKLARGLFWHFQMVQTHTPAWLAAHRVPALLRGPHHLCLAGCSGWPETHAQLLRCSGATYRLSGESASPFPASTLCTALNLAKRASEHENRAYEVGRNQEEKPSLWN